MSVIPFYRRQTTKSPEFARLNLPSVSEITTGCTETWVMAKQLWPNQPCAMTDVLERLKIPSNWKDALTEATQVALAYEAMQKLKIEV